MTKQKATTKTLSTDRKNVRARERRAEKKAAAEAAHTTHIQELAQQALSVIHPADQVSDVVHQPTDDRDALVDQTAMAQALDVVATVKAPLFTKPAAFQKRTPLQKRVTDLLRALRAHGKTPYGTRGQKAILAIAADVETLATAEGLVFEAAFDVEVYPAVAPVLAEIRGSLGVLAVA